MVCWSALVNIPNDTFWALALERKWAHMATWGKRKNFWPFGWIEPTMSADGSWSWVTDRQTDRQQQTDKPRLRQRQRSDITSFLSQKLEGQMRDVAYGTRQYKAPTSEVNKPFCAHYFLLVFLFQTVWYSGNTLRCYSIILLQPTSCKFKIQILNPCPAVCSRVVCKSFSLVLSFVFPC